MNNPTPSLDKKLEETPINVVIPEQNSHSYKRLGYIDGNSVEQIKQAFIDEGWINYNEGGVLHLPAGTFMTKDQWEQQAIKDGWVKLPQVIENTDPTAEWQADFKGLTINGKPAMTGREWFARFQEEVNKAAIDDQPNNITDDPIKILEAAKKAAGIS